MLPFDYQPLGEVLVDEILTTHVIGEKDTLELEYIEIIQSYKRWLEYEKMELDTKEGSEAIESPNLEEVKKAIKFFLPEMTQDELLKEKERLSENIALIALEEERDLFKL